MIHFIQNERQEDDITSKKVLGSDFRDDTQCCHLVLRSRGPEGKSEVPFIFKPRHVVIVSVTSLKSNQPNQSNPFYIRRGASGESRPAAL